MTHITDMYQPFINRISYSNVGEAKQICCWILMVYLGVHDWDYVKASVSAHHNSAAPPQSATSLNHLAPSILDIIVLSFPLGVSSFFFLSFFPSFSLNQNIYSVSKDVSLDVAVCHYALAHRLPPLSLPPSHTDSHISPPITPAALILAALRCGTHSLSVRL